MYSQQIKLCLRAVLAAVCVILALSYHYGKRWYEERNLTFEGESTRTGRRSGGSWLPWILLMQLLHFVVLLLIQYLTDEYAFSTTNFILPLTDEQPELALVYRIQYARLFSLLLVGPLQEEVVFRGVIWSMLRERYAVVTMVVVGERERILLLFGGVCVFSRYMCM
jgi:membrane protease YdiL (CAAX protease family)